MASAAQKAFRVTLYATVRVSVDVPDAESQLDAIKKAEASVNLHEDFRTGEYAEELVGVLVDEVGDDENLNSLSYIMDPKSGEWVAERAETIESPIVKSIEVDGPMSHSDFYQWALESAPALIAAANLQDYGPMLPTQLQASAQVLAEQALQELDSVVRKYHGFGVGDYFLNRNGQAHYLEGYVMPNGYEIPRMVAPLLNKDGSVSKRYNEFMFGATGFQKVDPKDIPPSK